MGQFCYVNAAVAKHFDNVFTIIKTEVVITEKQIAHIKERHPQDYERFSEAIPQVLSDPDYIIEANKPNSVVIMKRLENGEHFRLILRLKAAHDPIDYINSIISFWKLDKRRYDNYIRNKNILYKSE